MQCGIFIPDYSRVCVEKFLLRTGRLHETRQTLGCDRSDAIVKSEGRLWSGEQRICRGLFIGEDVFVGVVQLRPEHVKDAARVIILLGFG